MPIHIDGGNGQGNLLARKFKHQIFVFRLFVWVIAAPPVAQRKPRHQRYFARKRIQCLHRADIIRAERKHIQILLCRFARVHQPVLAEQQRFAVVKQRNAVRGDYPVF